MKAIDRKLIHNPHLGLSALFFRPFMQSQTILLAIAVLSYCLPTVAQAELKLSAEKEWVIVLDDPRPARLKGWQRSQYSARTNYDSELELKRYGKRFAKKHSMSINAQWFIESLQVYCLIVQFNDDKTKTIEALLKDKAVQWMQPSNEFTLQNTERNTSVDNSTSSSNLYNPPELLLPESMDGNGVVVAMIDSMVDKSHPELSHATLMQTDMVRERGKKFAYGEKHGTAMAGIIVADRRSQIGVTGVAPSAELVAYRGCWESNSQGGPNCNTLSLARALDAVSRSNAHILNLSLSGPKDRLLDQLVDQITANGTTVVASYDPILEGKERFPTPGKGVWIVGSSVNHSGSNSTSLFSAPGTKVVAAPGGKSDFMHGHSIATAYTSGVLALCKQIEIRQEKGICSSLDISVNSTDFVKDLHALVQLLISSDNEQT